MVFNIEGSLHRLAHLPCKITRFDCMLRASSPVSKVSRNLLYTQARMPLHHLMIGTWTPPGAIFTVAFDDEKLTLELVKRTEIPHDEPISWMTFDVSRGPREVCFVA